MPIANQRHLFDIEDGVTYLNCASHAPLLKAVYEAGQIGLRRKYHPWTIDNAETPAEAERLRGLFAGLIGAEADDVAIVNSTSYGIAVAARNLDIAAGQTIVVIEDQFPSNLFSWRSLAEAAGAALKVVPRPADGDWTPGVLEAIDAATAIAALPPCHWSDGSRLDLAAIGARCREAGAALVIDATQVAGAMALDVAEIQPDFLVSSAYKWLLCPYTLGFLYAAPHRQRGVPLEQHRWNMAGVQAEATEVAYPEDFAPGAKRYDMGERNNFINMPMAVAALEQLSAWTPAAIQETLAPLTDRAAALAAERGWAVPAQRVGHFIGIRPPEPPPGDIGARLKQEGIHISLRGGDALRISPHLFNDAADIERTFTALDRLLA
ncbi:MAG: aminotransferase class V-fold PLP-dependent enzyme [Magnetovibrio sp.]|nr:aminotransferase class V-fold PLP-dependent enzyme [Magnetovibrio sp.]